MKTYFQKAILRAALVLLITCLFSCKKKPGFSYVNADFKKYFDYQAGSYWVFYDSLNKYMDSLSVLTYNDRMPYTGESNELVFINMQHYYLDSMAFGNQWGIYLSPPPGCVLDIGNSFSYDIAENMPFKTGTFGDQSINISWTISLLPSFSINNYFYNNVYEIVYIYNTSSFSDTFYINADQGFLAVFLNDPLFHKRLFLNRCNLIR